jgi:hypothetical protein
MTTAADAWEATLAQARAEMIRLAEELRAEGPPILTHELLQVLNTLMILRDEVDPLGSGVGER